MNPLVIAHRGACWKAPENTPEAFELAVEEGADYVEFDVRARNGRPVICHDPDPPSSVPTLDEILETLVGRVGVCVEIKEEAVAEPTVEALMKHGVASDDLIVVSFLAGPLDTAQRLVPGVRTELHLGPQAEPTDAARFWGAGFEEPAPSERIREAHALGLATLAFTVNEPARTLELAELGVTGIFSDRPGLVRETLAGIPGPARGRSREERSR